MSNGFRDALMYLLPSSASGVHSWPKTDDYIDIGEFIVEETRPWYDPKCTCGCDKTYGPGNKLHTEYCDKTKRWR